VPAGAASKWLVARQRIARSVWPTPANESNAHAVARRHEQRQLAPRLAAAGVRSTGWPDRYPHKSRGAVAWRGEGVSVYRVAFLADFHLRDTGRDFDRAIALVADAIGPEVAADHVILGGDLVDAAQLGVVEELRDALRRLRVASSARLTVVPGNHDIFPVSKRWPYYRPSRPTANWRAFCDLFARARRGPGSRQLLRGEPYPVGKVLSRNVVLAALDSTRNHQLDPRAWAAGELPEEHVDAVEACFAAHASARHRIVVMHHCPWLPLTVGEHAAFPMGMAAPGHKTAVKWLRRAGATLVLCGHLHTRAGIERRALGGGLVGFRAGAAGAADDPTGLRVYHVIDLPARGHIRIAARELTPDELDER
jgi:hypothetical protein